MSIGKRILCLFCDGFEELELVAPVDLLRRAGAEVVLVSMDRYEVNGRNGIRLAADALFHDVEAVGFDLLLLPGGPSVAAMRQDGRAATLAAAWLAAGKPIAAICAAPLILHDAGLLVGKRFACHPAARAELFDAVDGAVIEDGLLITSRGAGTAVEFGLAIVARLFGQSKARDLAQEIAR